MISRSKILIILVTIIVWMSCRQHQRVPMQADSALQTSLQRLLEGNDRFCHFYPIHPDEDLQHLQSVSKVQHPFAIIICCSDSRISPELVFDQGIGDLFVIRTAGNIIGDLEIGSVEYAVEHLGVNLIMVMGHENCGAVKTFIDGTEVSGHIKDIIDSLKQEVEIKKIPITDSNLLDDYVNANVFHGVKKLQSQSPIIREKKENGALLIVAARYDLDDFKVSLIKE